MRNKKNSKHFETFFQYRIIIQDIKQYSNLNFDVEYYNRVNIELFSKYFLTQYISFNIKI